MSPFDFIKISQSSVVINARAGPWVDASILKVKSRSHSIQPSVKRRPNPLHSEGGKKMQFLIPLKKYNIFLSPIKTSLMERFGGGEAVEARALTKNAHWRLHLSGLHECLATARYTIKSWLLRWLMVKLVVWQWVGSFAWISHHCLITRSL